MIQDRKEFVTFLVEAKTNTYAANANYVEPARPGTRELVYRSGGYEYRDAYYGGFHFLGEEVVSRDQRHAWGMNYYGHLLVPSFPDGFSEFLKEALRKVHAFSPYRGPRYHRSGPFEYSCTWFGELEAFNGFESISRAGQKVYELQFHGGIIQE